MSKIPSLEEMLKLYTKKDLWERIQQHIQTIDQLKQQLEKEKAENKTLKEFADKLDEEFGKNVEPTLSERADNIIALHRSNKKYCEIADEKIKELKQRLEEKDKEIDYWKDKTRNKILNMKATDFMKMCLSCGLMLDITEQQVPLAVRELEKAKDLIKHFCKIHSDEYYGVKAQVKGIEQDVCEEIDNKIKELKGE